MNLRCTRILGAVGLPIPRDRLLGIKVQISFGAKLSKRLDDFNRDTTGTRDSDSADLAKWWQPALENASRIARVGLR